MGFNPFRRHTPSVADIVLVVATLATAIGLTLWAILAR
jgi:hypothetical protein